MKPGKRIVLAAWIVVNAAMLAFVIVSPQTTEIKCKDEPAAEPGGQGPVIYDCFTVPKPIVERRYVLGGAVLGNGIVFAAWVLTRSKNVPPDKDPSS